MRILNRDQESGPGKTARAAERKKAVFRASDRASLSKKRGHEEIEERRPEPKKEKMSEVEAETDTAMKGVAAFLNELRRNQVKKEDIAKL